MGGHVLRHSSPLSLPFNHHTCYISYSIQYQVPKRKCLYNLAAFFLSYQNWYISIFRFHRFLNNVVIHYWYLLEIGEWTGLLPNWENYLSTRSQGRFSLGSHQCWPVLHFGLVFSSAFWASVSLKNLLPYFALKISFKDYNQGSQFFQMGKLPSRKSLVLLPVLRDTPYICSLRILN